MSKFLLDLSRHSDTSKKLGKARSIPRLPSIGSPDLAVVESGAPEFQAELAQASTGEVLRALEAELGMPSKFLRSIGLFDEEFYKMTYPDVVSGNRDPFEHFYLHGYLEGRRPNAVFDPSWYMTTYPDVREAGTQPLLHYANVGERSGYRPSPHFDPVWYRKAYEIPENLNALAHYLKNRLGPFSPIPEFDAKYYLETYKDIAEAKVDPFEHFIFHGFREGRNPSNEFDTKFYIQRYFKGEAVQNPLLHYLEHRDEPGIFPRPPENEATIPAEIKRFTKPGPAFEELRPLSPKAKPRAKILANYLTQFHAFPENDKWWGTGFTEWTNIARGVPRFRNHYQPRIPRDLGFYSLEHEDVMHRQVELAKGAGVHGFVFYYYSFNGKRLMERPLEQFLEDTGIDMPFCLMWANENWTRRWDGMEGEVLISQDYLSEDDELLVKDFARHFADRRYIRLQGRPLLMIYRPRLIPDTARTIARWRALFSDRYDEDPIIVMSQSFDDVDPRPFGLDGAVEFPPHKVTKHVPQINSEAQCLDDTFGGQIYRYDDVARYSLEEPTPPFPLIKTAVPSWDNDARRQGKGLVIHGSTPSKYEAWLGALVEKAQREPFFGEPIVCINAWNEWCEGAYLEPDLHFGSAYLNATGRAVAGLRPSASRPKILLVGHDAFPSGAQHLLLNIGKTLRTAFGVEIEFLLLGDGELAADYASVGPLTVAKDPQSLAAKIQGLRDGGLTAAIVNTTASGNVVSMLAAQNIHTVLLVHELPRLLHDKGLESSARAGIASAHHVVFASAFVRDRLIEALGIADDSKLLIRPQGNYKNASASSAETAALRQELAIPAGGAVVLGVGYADLRKGFDLFLQVWRLLRTVRKPIHFVWLGGIDPGLREWLGAEIEEAEATGTFQLAGFRSDVGAFYEIADVFALVSREDPFPTVAIEAMNAGVPVIAFNNSGGIPEFLKENQLGYVVPYCDTLAMAGQLKTLLTIGVDQEERERTKEVCEARFAFAPYVRDLLHLALPRLPSISVVVPNYNYAHCLPERLSSIFDQSHPVEEIIILDDASSDNSLTVIEDVAAQYDRDLTLVINEENSGSVFAQWAKAAEMASGEFIWIAEADDLSEPSFLSSLIAMMAADPSIRMGFCDSKSIDAEGFPVFPDYKAYFASIEPNALTRSEIFDGREFISRFLSVKNTILNVSSVLWRRDALVRALAGCRADLARYRMAGDWRIYLQCLSAEGAKLAYVADPLNVHRRHAHSVTHSLKARKHVEEIADMHQVIRERVHLPRASLVSQARYLEEVTAQLVGDTAHSAAPRQDERRDERRGEREDQRRGERVAEPAQ
jgi:Glycosyltransferase WbsX/Glycosyl transferases group 1/Glycosyl transferase family 2